MRCQWKSKLQGRCKEEAEVAVLIGKRKDKWLCQKHLDLFIKQYLGGDMNYQEKLKQLKEWLDKVFSPDQETRQEAIRQGMPHFETREEFKRALRDLGYEKEVRL